MTKNNATLWCVLVGSFVACGPLEQPTITIDQLSDMVDVPDEVVRASSSLQTFANGTPTVLYVNFEGGVINKGNKSDSSTNTTFIGGGTVPPFNGDQAAKDTVTATVKQLYKSYNIQVVTNRPASGNYDMVMVGGKPSDLGLSYGNNVTGVAPMDCGNKMPRDIAFVFSDSIKALVPASKYTQKVSETSSHESAHTYGLPHSNTGCDLMSYKSCAQLKTFLDQQMQMQSDSYGKCGLTSMNSHQLLLGTLGAASASPPPPPPPPADTDPPKVTITAPVAGAKVGPSTSVTATITDNTGVTKAELLVDGTMVGTDTTAPFQFQASLSPGSHTLVVNAHDAAGNKGSATVAVSVAPPPPHPDSQPPQVKITSPAEGATVSTQTTVTTTVTDNEALARVELLVDGQLTATLTAAPFDFQVALTPGNHTLRVEGEDAAGNRGSAAVTITAASSQTPDPGTTPPGAVPPGTVSPPGTYGSQCQSAEDCDSGLCAEDEAFTGKYCTETCVPDDGSCPTGAACFPTNTAAHVCGPPASPVNPADAQLLGGCSVGAGPSAPPALLLLLLPMLLRRRKQG